MPKEIHPNKSLFCNAICGVCEEKRQYISLNETQYHLLSEIHLILALTQQEGKNVL